MYPTSLGRHRSQLYRHPDEPSDPSPSYLPLLVFPHCSEVPLVEVNRRSCLLLFEEASDRSADHSSRPLGPAFTQIPYSIASFPQVRIWPGAGGPDGGGSTDRDRDRLCGRIPRRCHRQAHATASARRLSFDHRRIGDECARGTRCGRPDHGHSHAACRSSASGGSLHKFPFRRRFHRKSLVAAAPGNARRPDERALDVAARPQPARRPGGG